ncbi:MAG: ATP-dependent Clp protease adaptor ClpS [Clostridiales bacterium]|jgi:ATP-dependent Clp protease adaptor protein ClpS|nr:ATP-dependent Clp protease adaptor ClpS [Clostridiales bacterium]
MSIWTRGGAEPEKAQAVARPNMYAVVMHNDDFMTMDFVIDLLVKVFNKSSQQARALTMQVHRQGSGVAGIYTYDLAVSKRLQAERFAEENAFPLRLSVEIS